MDWSKYGCKMEKLRKGKLLISLIVCEAEVEIASPMKPVCKCLPFVDSTSGSVNEIVHKGIEYL